MRNKTLSWVIFAVLCIVWGSSFILMKYSKDELPSAQIAALRILSAGLVFLPLGIVHIRKIPRGRLLLVILTGVFGNLVPAFLFAEAIAKGVDSSLAGILNSLTPVCVVAIAILFFKDRIRRQQWAGILLGFAGLVALTITEDSISLENVGYSLLIVLGTLSYGINVNLVAHYLKGLNPLYMASVSLSFMLIPTGLILWQQGFFQTDFGPQAMQNAIWASIALGVLGSAVATALFYRLVQHAGGRFPSLVTYGIPFVALFWGLYFGEKVTLPEIICLVVILAGVYLANRKPAVEENRDI